MATAYSNTQPHRLRESSLDRRQKGHLRTIMEEDCDIGRVQQDMVNQQNKRFNASHLRIEAWLSPMSDHFPTFPTPNGVHHLAAPNLPSSPSSVSAGGSSPTTFSRRWARISATTDGTEFDDLYDVTDEEDDGPTGPRRSFSAKRRSQARVLNRSTNQQLTPLVIPGQQDDLEELRPAVGLKKTPSPAPLTSSAKIPMSPAQMDFMGRQQALEVLPISAPPSLDGSLNSEQLAAMSSPPTPVIGSEVDDTEESWAGIQLQPGALATLQALSSGEDEESEELLSEELDRVFQLSQTSLPPPPSEMQQHSLRLVTDAAPQAHNRGWAHSTRSSRQSFGGLTNLEIPSPGVFFGGLSPLSREAWHLPTLSPCREALAPPTSTTAEQFYRCPWNVDASVVPARQIPDAAEDFYRSAASGSALLSSAPIEQIIEVAVRDEDDDVSVDLPTAKPIPPPQTCQASAERAESSASSEEGLVPTEIVVDYDPDYARKQQLEALSNLDRTEQWLMAQRAYLRGVEDIEDVQVQAKAVEQSQEEEAVEEIESKPEQTKAVAKKTVRFSEIITTTPSPPKFSPKILRQESAYYRAFQDYVVRTQRCDVFVHQLPRFEALQAQRGSLRLVHHNQLLGKYQLSVVPQSAKKRLSANVARGDDTLIDDPEKLRKEKELDAMKQMTMATWHVTAVKFLNGGKLITAPVTKRLARLSRMAPGKDGVTRDRARILDLGGQSTCDWAWHCALQYPNAKIYTVTTKAVRQLSNSNIRGPSNHRQVAVERLTKLPFADNQFDLVSARELHSLLKLHGENGEDEWETCLRECMRVLKPGGYLEFSLLDSDIMNAGPIGLAKSVEFGYSLQTLGYDPNPTKLWLGRLARAGFQDVRRAWLCLPLGAKPAPPSPPKHDSMISEVEVSQMDETDSMTMGSTDNIANVCSIAAGWTWERWLLRCEMEKVAGELRLADTVTAGPAMKEAGKCLAGVNAVMEEGRNCRAGFRMLNGYARKP